jgi:Flp pilus assembly protein TadG
MRRNRFGSEHGAAAVEFALVFPVLVVMLFGMIEFGAVYNAQIQVTAAAREGVRAMIVSGDPATASAAAVDAGVGLSPALTAADMTFSAPSCSAGTTMELTIVYDKPFLTGLFGATIALTGKAVRECGG